MHDFIAHTLFVLLKMGTSTAFFYYFHILFILSESSEVTTNSSEMILYTYSAYYKHDLSIYQDQLTILLTKWLGFFSDH